MTDEERAEQPEEWEQIAQAAWKAADAGDERNAINAYAMDWLQRLEIVSKSEAASEDVQEGLQAFLDAYRRGSGAPVAAGPALSFLAGLVAWQFGREANDSSASMNIIQAAIILAYTVGVNSQENAP